MTTVDAVRRLALSLPRTSEHLIRDQVKFRIGRIVYVAFSRDETVMGFGFPKEERAALVESEPDHFPLASRSAPGSRWVQPRLGGRDAPAMDAPRTATARTSAVPDGPRRSVAASFRPGIRQP